MAHVNINCSNYEVSKTLYELLGFEEVWQEPRDDNPPYAHLYHKGLSRLALQTTDIQLDCEFLKASRR